MNPRRYNTALEIIHGPQIRKVFHTNKNSFYIGRPDPSRGWMPDVDLTPDYRVSRKHARVFLKDGQWVIEDLGSKHGTVVKDIEIRSLSKPASLIPGEKVITGDTTWTLKPPVPHPDDIDIEVKDLPINYATYHCDMPAMTSLKISNRCPCTWPPSMLTVKLNGYSKPLYRDLPAIQAGGHILLKDIKLSLDGEKLRAQRNLEKAELEIMLNDKVVLNKNISILGLYEWSSIPVFRKALASYVIPAHPIVLDIATQASHLPPAQTALKDTGNKAFHLTRAVYECLARNYNIHYVHNAPIHRFHSQAIRIPDHVIFDPPDRKGEGTCIDLALLMAGCLENLRLQPLIFIVKEDHQTQHAFLGCWKVETERYEPILTDFRRLKTNLDNGKLFIVESTGITDRWHVALSYEEAVKKANELFTIERFIFALDVAASRSTIDPLQFAMDPDVIKITRLAVELAQKEGNRNIETKHLMYAFFKSGSQRVLELLKKLDLDPSDFKMRIPGNQTHDFGCVPRATKNYRLILADAHIIAGDCKIKTVDVEHIFYALILSQSRSVDKIFRQIGVDRKTVRNTFEAQFDWTNHIERTRFREF